MTEKRTDSDRIAPARFAVSADRDSPSRRVRYVETNRDGAQECRLCQLDSAAPSTSGETMQPQDENDEAFAAEALIEAIENQLEADTPPAVRATLNKLTLVGYEREDSLHLMALVLADEIRHMLAEERPFDSERYSALLRQLPDLPDDPAAGDAQ